MINIERLKNMADAGDGSEMLPISRRWLKQAADELAEGRRAKAELQALTAERGRVFGLGPEQRL